MIELKLDVKSIWQQLLNGDMTELMRYIDSVEKTAIGTVFKYGMFEFDVYDLCLEFNKITQNVSVVASAQLVGTDEDDLEFEQFWVAEMDFANGCCETKSIRRDNIKVEFI